MAEQKFNTNNINNQNQTQVPPLVQMDVEHQPFNNVISTATVTSVNLEKVIAELFSASFEDFEGCKIIPVQNGQMETLKCKVYFKPVMSKGEGHYAVKVRGEDVTKPTNRGKGLNLSEVVNTINMLSTSKQFELEDVAKELLAEFLIIRDAKIVKRWNPELNKEVDVRLPKNWNMYTEEVSDTVPNTRFQNPYLVVTLDLLPIVERLYGKKDSEEEKALKARGIMPKNRYQYSINIVRVINPTMCSYILEIRRMDKNELDKLAQSIGFGMVSGNIIMTKG